MTGRTFSRFYSLPRYRLLTGDEHSLGSTDYLDTDYWQEEYSLGSRVYLDTDYGQEEHSLGSTVYLDTDYWQEVSISLTC